MRRNSISSKLRTKILSTNLTCVLYRTKKATIARRWFTRNKRLRCSKLRWKIFVRRTKTIVPIGTTSWREPVCSRSLTTTKGANWNIWIIWFGRLRPSAAQSVFNQANTPISNFSRSSNFHLNRLDLNFDSKWYLAARPINSKWCVTRHRVFRFTTMAKSLASTKTRDSLEKKDPSQR